MSQVDLASISGGTMALIVTWNF